MRGRDPNDPRRWRDDDERRTDEDWREEWRPGENRWREERGGFGYGNYGSAGGYGPSGGSERRFGRQIDPDDWQSRVDWHGRVGGYETESYDPYENRAGRRDRDRDRDRGRFGEHRGEDRGLFERAGDWLQRKLGKAPKGYRRSDERIREDLSEVIWRRFDIDASDVEIVVKDAEVTLVGNVNDRRTKRLLEDLAEDCLGVIDVHNQIKIRREAQNGNRERAGAATSSSTAGSTASSTTSTSKTPRA